MTTQYNVVTYGNLTNTNGVLSGFSASNYATLPLNFNPALLYYDIVFKFNTANVSQEQTLFIVYNANNYTFPVVDIEIFNSVLYFETTNGESQLSEIDGTTTLNSNMDYWVKVNRNGNTYTLSLSTDGITFVSEGTYTTSSHPPLDNYTSLIGLNYNSIDGFKLPFDGSIDLNESYIDIDNIRWWQGATVISNVRTKVQLRHDTAANWTSVNPILLEGEVGIETDTRKQKFGDGVTAWNSLPYDKGSTALQSITSSNVTTALGYTPVNKAGDTMSGDLSTSGRFSTEKGLNVNHTTITRDGTTPSAGSWKNIIFNDNSSTPKRLALVESAVKTDLSTTLDLLCYRNTSSDATAKLSVGFKSDGNKYTFCPACEDNDSIVTTIAKNKAQNGYYKLGNGLIIQWGTVSSTTGTTGQVTLPTAFTSSNYQITYGSSTNLSIGTTSQTTTNFDWKKASTNASINWIAVGY